MGVFGARVIDGRFAMVIDLQAPLVVRWVGLRFPFAIPSGSGVRNPIRRGAEEGDLRQFRSIGGNFEFALTPGFCGFAIRPFDFPTAPVDLATFLSRGRFPRGATRSPLGSFRRASLRDALWSLIRDVYRRMPSMGDRALS